MHFDPYESKEARKRRVISNVSMIVIGVLLITGILALIFRNTSNPQYDFEHFGVSDISVAEITEGENEFKQLSEFAKSGKGPMFNDSFKEQFPTASALLSMTDGVYDSKKPTVSINGGYIALAQCVISNAVDCRDLTVLLIKTETVKKEKSIILKLSDISEFTVRYNTRESSVPLTYLPNDQGTHINLYQFSMAFTESTLTESRYSLYINKPFEPERAKEKLYHHIVFDPINTSYHQPEVKMMEESTLIYIDSVKAAPNKDGINSAKYRINMDDKTFYMVEQIEFHYFISSVDTAKISFEFN